MADSTKKMMRLIRREGWSVEMTPSGRHLVCRHPDAITPIYTGATPSDHRHMTKLKADFRRAIKAKQSSSA